MPLLVSGGPANSGVQERAIQRALDAGRGAWIVVPSQTEARLAREALVRCAGGAAVVGVAVGTFRDLARYVAVASGVDVSELPRGADRVLARRVAAQTYGGSPSPGEIESVVRTVDRLRGVRMGGDVALLALRDSVAESQLDEMQRLADGYEAVLDERGVWDDTRFVAHACEHPLPASILPYVAVVGFLDIGSRQRALAAALARETTVDVVLDVEHNRHAYAHRDSLIEHFAALGAHVNVDPAPAERATKLEQIADVLFEPGRTLPDVHPDTQTIRFVEASGALAEAEAVAHEAARLVRSGIAESEIVVLAADPAASRALVHAAFERAGLRLRVAAARRIDETPAGAAVCALLDAAAGSFDAMLSLAASAYWSADAGDVRTFRARIDDLDARVPDPDGTRWMADAFVPEVLRVLRHGRGSALLDALVDALGSLLSVDTGSSRLLLSVVEALTGLRDVDDRELTFDEACAAVRSLSISSPQDTDALDGAVELESIAHSGWVPRRAAIWFGLHSGAMPARDADGAEHPAIARELALHAVGRAAERLVCVRRANDVDGEPLAPHPVWLELRRVAAGVAVHARSLGDVTLSPADVVTVSESRAALALAHGTGRMVEGANGWTAEVERTLEALEPDGEIGEAGDLVGQWLDAHPNMRVTALEGAYQCPAKWFGQQVLGIRDSGYAPHRELGSLLHGALERLVPMLARRAPADRIPSSAEIDAAIEHAAASIPGGVREIELEAARIRLAAFLAGAADNERPGLPYFAEAVRTEQSFGTKETDTFPPLQVDGIAVSGKIDRIDVLPNGSAVLVDYKSGMDVGTAADQLETGRLQLLAYWLALDAASAAGGEEVPHPIAAFYAPIRADKKPRGPWNEELFASTRTDDPAAAAKRVVGTDARSEDEIAMRLGSAREAMEQTVDGLRGGHVAAELRLNDAACDYCDLALVCRKWQR